MMSFICAHQRRMTGCERQVVHAVIVGALEIGEQRVGLGVEVDRIIGDALRLEQRLQAPARSRRAGGGIRRAAPGLRNILKAWRGMGGLRRPLPATRRDGGTSVRGRWPPESPAPLTLTLSPQRGERDAGSVQKSNLSMLLLVEDEGRAEQDLAAVDDVELAELARLDRGVAGLELAVDRRAQHVGRRVAEVDRVPQHHRLDAVGVDIGLHRVRRREADDRDLAAQARPW